MSDPQQYTLHWRGRETGPYPLGKIKHMLADGRITPEHEILADGRWIALHEFLAREAENKEHDAPVEARVRDVAPSASVAQKTAPKNESHKARRALLWLLLFLLVGFGVFACWLWSSRDQQSTRITMPHAASNATAQASQKNYKTSAPDTAPAPKEDAAPAANRVKANILQTKEIQLRFGSDGQTGKSEPTAVEETSQSEPKREQEKADKAEENSGKSAAAKPNGSTQSAKAPPTSQTRTPKAVGAETELNPHTPNQNEPKEQPSKQKQASPAGKASNAATGNSGNGTGSGGNGSGTGNSGNGQNESKPSGAGGSAGGTGGASGPGDQGNQSGGHQPNPTSGNGNSGSSGADTGKPAAQQPSSNGGESASGGLGGLAGQTSSESTGVSVQRTADNFVSSPIGTPVRSQPVVFLIDQSFSMRGAKGEAAQKELRDLLGKLDPKDSFYILFFHSSGFNPMPAAEPLPATPENIQSMLGWSSKVPAKFGSKPAIGAFRALDFKPKTVWVITDGKFPKAASAEITKSNQAVHTQINTVGIYSRSGEGNLRELAEKNGGVYRFVPGP